MAPETRLLSQLVRCAKRISRRGCRQSTLYYFLRSSDRTKHTQKKSLVNSDLQLNKTHVPLMPAVLLSLRRDLKLCILATLRSVYVSLSPTARVQLHRIYRVLLND